jgi:hypothetical protein
LMDRWTDGYMIVGYCVTLHPTAFCNSKRD